MFEVARTFSTACRSTAVRGLVAIVGLSLAVSHSLAQERRQAPDELTATSINMEDVPYPYPVEFIELQLHGHDLRMVYMDAEPQGASNGGTVVLLHGMNWYGEYWGDTMDRLTAEGYRVVVPDQIGFGRSSKPIMPYSLNDHMANTRELLDHLGVEQAAILGHSMGGAMATRFAASYPETTTHLVLVNPIRLTDARPHRNWTRLQESYEGRSNRDYESVRSNFERYFVEWDEKYEYYVAINYGWTLSSEWPRLSMVRALNSRMLTEDSTVHDRPHVEAKTLFLSGAEDGADFPANARQTVEDIPDATLHLIENVGHVPHFEAPDQFYPPLLEFLASDP